MIYYRDPLLDKICDRILELGEPAFIKNSELVYVAVNEPFASLFNAQVSTLVGTKGEGAELEALLDIEDKERACLIFGEDQTASFVDPFGKGRFHVEMERFTLSDGQTFLYCVFKRMGATVPRDTAAAAPVRPETKIAEKSRNGGGISDELASLILDSQVAGICVYNAADELIYFNARLQELYGPIIGDLKLGMTKRDILTRLSADGTAGGPGNPGADRSLREKWVDKRIADFRHQESADLMHLSNGTWVKCVNHRLPSGVLIGLRVDVTDMKKKEALLERHVDEAGLYRELLNRLPVAAFVRDSEQRLAFINQAYCDLFGKSYNDLIGTTEHELLGDDAGRVAAANRETLINGTDYEQEELTPVSDGRVASTIVKTGRLISEKGNPYVVGTVIDISSIHQRETLLKRATEQAEAIRQDFENIVGSIDVGLILLDRDFNIVLVNDAYRQRIWGSAGQLWQGELVGRPYRDLLLHNFNVGRVPADFTDFDTYYASRIDEIRSGSIDTREVFFPDGTVTLYSGIKLSGGKFLLCYVDLTELRKRDTEVDVAHREAAHAYQLVLSATDTMQEGLMVIESGKLALTNRSLAKLLNVPEELLEVGRPWEDAFIATCWQNPDADDDFVELNLNRFRAAIESIRDVSYNFPLDGERWVHVEMRHKAHEQTVIVCSDLTEMLRREEELKRLIAKAEAADRAKSEFLANMSLEIRTPMNGILGMAELLSKSPLDTRQKAFIDIIMKSGNALMTIITDILDFSKLDSGNMQLKYAPYDPAESLEDVAGLFAQKAEEKNIELIVRRDGPLPATIFGDAGRFRQILNNLIGNAVKFTDGGHVIASIAANYDEQNAAVLSIMIEDTGKGIPADKLNTIFDKFSQVDITSNRREGTGLGLAISQRLANVQGGAISVHSTEGVGSVFTLTLPVQVAAEAPRARPLPANVEGARVLVVDDHDIARDHILSHVSGWGFECVGAADGRTAMQILEVAAESRLDVDVVVIDSRLPDMEGRELVRLIRSNPALANLSMVLLTSLNEASSEAFSSEVKVDACLTKPIRVTLLRDTLIDVVRTGRSHDLWFTAPSPRAPASEAGNTTSHKTVATTPTPAAQPVPTRPYILLAEDNEVNRLFFSQILEAAGFEYMVAENGEVALDICAKSTPALILMDTSMPVLDGFATARRIRSAEAGSGRHTPIIAVVSHASEDDAGQFASAGMDDYIVKPVTPERLEEKIRQLLNPGAPGRLADGLSA